MIHYSRITPRFKNSLLTTKQIVSKIRSTTLIAIFTSSPEPISNWEIGSRSSWKALKELDEATEPAFQASDLETTRIQFGKISAALIKLLSDYRPALTQEWKVMRCPMWTKSPARWLQTDQEIHNPFIGTAMSTCGQTIGSDRDNELKSRPMIESNDQARDIR